MWPHRRGRPPCLPEQQMPKTTTQRTPRWVFDFGERADTGVCPYTRNILLLDEISGNF